MWDEDSEDDDGGDPAEMLKRAAPGIVSEAYGRGYAPEAVPCSSGSLHVYLGCCIVARYGFIGMQDIKRSTQPKALIGRACSKHCRMQRSPWFPI